MHVLLNDETIKLTLAKYIFNSFILNNTTFKHNYLYTQPFSAQITNESPDVNLRPTL